MVKPTINAASAIVAIAKTAAAPAITARYLVWEYLHQQQRALTTRQLAVVFPNVADINSVLSLLLKGKHATRARVKGSNYYTYSATDSPPLKLRKNNVQGVDKQYIKQVKVPLQRLISAASLAQARQFTSAPLVRPC